MILPILEQALPFLPLVIGLYISYGILQIADLSTDASFLVGAALFGIALRSHFSPALSLCFAMAAGVVIGCTVALLHCRLHSLLCGILMVFILSTLILKVMGKPNLSLLEYPASFSLFSLSCIGIILVGLISIFLHSKVGLLLHGFGGNPSLFHLLGKNGILYRMIGLSIHGCCAAISGALTAATNGYVDISMGIGIVLIALGTLILGQKIYQYFFFPSPYPHITALACSVIAVFIYFFLLHTLLRIGLDPMYLKLAIGLFLMSLLITTHKERLI